MRKVCIWCCGELTAEPVMMWTGALGFTYGRSELPFNTWGEREKEGERERERARGERERFLSGKNMTNSKIFPCSTWSVNRTGGERMRGGRRREERRREKRRRRQREERRRGRQSTGADLVTVDGPQPLVCVLMGPQFHVHPYNTGTSQVIIPNCTCLMLPVMRLY